MSVFFEKFCSFCFYVQACDLSQVNFHVWCYMLFTLPDRLSVYSITHILLEQRSSSLCFLIFLPSLPAIRMLTPQGRYSIQVLSESLLAQFLLQSRCMINIWESCLILFSLFYLFHTCSPKSTTFNSCPSFFPFYLELFIFASLSHYFRIYRLQKASCLEILLFPIHLHTTVRPVLPKKVCHAFV